MAVSIVLLRGINLGPTNRIAMPALRAALSDAGFENPRTYVQSGNIAVDTDLAESELTDGVQRLITERFGLTVAAVARSGRDLARVVAENPYPQEAAQEPKRLQVSFVEGSLRDDLQAVLEGLAGPAERVAVSDRHIYAWHPEGVARSKLWAKLGAKGGLGRDVTVTSRNWTTVLALLEMATADA
jgi:uncharacterized protein (DUF1697 family)